MSIAAKFRALLSVKHKITKEKLKMKNTIKLDHENRRIVMDKTFAKLSADVRNEE